MTESMRNHRHQDWIDEKPFGLQQMALLLFFLNPLPFCDFLSFKSYVSDKLTVIRLFEALIYKSFLFYYMNLYSYATARWSVSDDHPALRKRELHVLWYLWSDWGMYCIQLYTIVILNISPECCLENSHCNFLYVARIFWLDMFGHKMFLKII